MASPSLNLTPMSGGFMLAVKVVPGASRQRVTGGYADGIKITVTRAPVAGAANEAVITLLAGVLGISPAQITIMRGHTSPRKQVVISGLAEDVIRRRLLDVDR